MWIGLAFSLFSRGQDIHFSQFGGAPLTINPALTGLFNGNGGRFILNHRNQWNTVTVPYFTIAGSYDMKLNFRQSSREIFGGGINFFSDKAGDGALTTNQVNANLSYTRSLDVNNTYFMSLGMQIGYGQKSLNFDKLTFDKQWDGDVFDPTLYNGENIITNKFGYLDVSGGLNFTYTFTERKGFNIGLSAFHLNQPKNSFYYSNETLMSTRYNLHGSASIMVNSRLDLIPCFLLMKQGTQYEATVGSYTKFIINPESIDYKAFYIGYFYRILDRDAVVLQAKVDYLKYTLGVSYDINLSDLAAASKNNGGYEFSFIYLFDINRVFHMKRYPCPNF